MGVMDKFLSAMKLSDMDDDYDDEDYYEEDEEIDEKPRKSVPVTVAADDDSDLIDLKKKNAQKVTPIRQVRKAPGNGMEVCVIKPTSVEDTKEITDTLLSNRTVVLNLEGLDVDTSQRIIDFASGSTYAIHGNLQKISNFIFILTPSCVDISGDFQEMFSGTFDAITRI